MINTTSFSENEINVLMDIMSALDGVKYEHYTSLRLSRPAICLSGSGSQKTITYETAKQILKENNV